MGGSVKVIDSREATREDYPEPCPAQFSHGLLFDLFRLPQVTALIYDFNFASDGPLRSRTRRRSYTLEDIMRPPGLGLRRGYSYRSSSSKSSLDSGRPIVPSWVSLLGNMKPMETLVNRVQMSSPSSLGVYESLWSRRRTLYRDELHHRHDDARLASLIACLRDDRPMRTTAMPFVAVNVDWIQKEPGNVVRGLEAAMNNPNVSEETKNRDAARIEEMGEDYSGPYRDSSVGGPDKNYSGPSTRTRLQEGEPVAKETMRNIKKANDIVESSLFKDGKQPLDSDERFY
ncbi:hypothetical protein NMY22_g18017 [Coprinellus aureogranulatus]|nr:hypothetical protein NMY22_g18017 [Coprinellus aureogranulatus]